MTTKPAYGRDHLLLYEPRTDGHHLGWLRFLTEDLLSANFQLSLAVDLRPAAKGKIEDHLSGLLSEVRLISASDAFGKFRWGGKVGAVGSCLRQSDAHNVFLCAFDEIASRCWRRAALGLLPPAELRGRIGGIYHRPRFLAAHPWTPNRWLKQTGFRRLMTKGWLRQILFVDEYLARGCRVEMPAAPIFFLPDPCPCGYDGDQSDARRQLGVPVGHRVFLFYGGGYRRKGLHLAVEAMLGLPERHAPFLLCVGQQNPKGITARGLDQLVQQGRARLINRYVSVAEEKLSFAACDLVLLPYLNHFGTSGVLSRAMSAGKAVIVSDEQLLAQLTRQYGLGLLFPSGNVATLRERIREATTLSREQLVGFAVAAKEYACIYSRTAYRTALLASLGVQPAPQFG
jgi:glycosyltransferase involved in cell wall biosynthesis